MIAAPSLERPRPGPALHGRAAGGGSQRSRARRHWRQARRSGAGSAGGRPFQHRRRPGAPRRPPAALTDEERQAVFGLAKCGGRPTHRPARRVACARCGPCARADRLRCRRGQCLQHRPCRQRHAGDAPHPICALRSHSRLHRRARHAALIVNAKWNPVRDALSSFARGRPLGDCGTTETYLWDGAMFRLSEARAMPVCRGAWGMAGALVAGPVAAPPTKAQAAAR